MTEAERRALWCVQQRNRIASERARCAMLAGNPAARRALQCAWQPLIDYLHERGSSYEQSDQTDPAESACPQIA